MPCGNTSLCSRKAAGPDHPLHFLEEKHLDDWTNLWLNPIKIDIFINSQG